MFSFSPVAQTNSWCWDQIIAKLKNFSKIKSRRKRSCPFTHHTTFYFFKNPTLLERDRKSLLNSPTQKKFKWHRKSLNANRKIASHQFIHLFNECGGLPWMVLRATNTAGTRRDEGPCPYRAYCSGIQKIFLMLLLSQWILLSPRILS